MHILRSIGTTVAAIGMVAASAIGLVGPARNLMPAAWIGLGCLTAWVLLQPPSAYEPRPKS